MSCDALTAIDGATALLACVGAVTVFKWWRAIGRLLKDRL
jgi:hypothetical protein